MNRRDALKLAFAGAASFAMPKLMASSGAGLASTLFSASENNIGQYQLSLFTLATNEARHFALPFRAHDILPLPSTNQVLAFGRRPQMQCVLVNTDGSGTAKEMNATEGRHFFGHGCLNTDNSVLFTTESEYDEARGVIGLRDANTLQPIGEYESYGMGPHDIHLMPDGKTLVVANGGIETHPDYGRRKLNIETMQPSLVYIDVASGKKIDEYRLDDHQLSIRHIAVSPTGGVGVATQFQGDLSKRQPNSLVAWQQNGGNLVNLQMPKALIESLKGYIADIAYNDINQQLVVTAPRGNQVLLWDLQHQSAVKTFNLSEPSGISVYDNSFVISNTKGALMTLDPKHPISGFNEHYKDSNINWDNHLTIS
ncbi:DUF1513 domain-containing protein [Leucothrix arctica]|uniref:DUF1513 domain-containing protein n=1 Tax=Leucothrix arctica TaxID=1481894 RepID=A0A317C7G4_9GAMM|nr:DUF1513 domain-containing protein [Leucothrix arctica]PWQ94227.1 hypothetical protein DKT75_16975 [Leucothrix arctica]